MTGNPPTSAAKPQFVDLAAQLWRATQSAAWEEVAALARTLRAECPSQPLGYTRGAFALRHLRRFDEADAVILDAILLFPADPQALIEACRVAQGREDWSSAIRRSAALIERFPDQAAGYLIRAHAHRCRREYSDSKHLLAQGAARFPDMVDFAIESCWLVLAEHDWEGAVERSAELRLAHPSAPAGYQVAISALKHLKRWSDVGPILDAATGHFGTSEWILMESLKLAQQQQGPERVVELAERVVERTPSEVSAYHVGAAAYRQLGRPKEAEQLLERAIGNLEPNVHVLCEFAWSAHDRGDFAAADTRWSEAKRLFPHDRTVSLWHARIPVFPGRVFGDGDIAESHRRYDEIHRTFPDLAVAYADHIKMFRTANRLHEATEVGRLACAVMPGNAQIRLEYSQVAADQGRLAEALSRLTEVQDRFGDDIGFQCRLVAAMAAAGKHEEAETACAVLRTRHEGVLQPHVEFAELAMRRHDWSTASERWAAIDRAFPGLPWIRKRLFDAQLAAADDAQAMPEVHSVARQDGNVDSTLETILSQFESLAGTFQGCEFGRVQRHFNCEPLGLFRWAQIDIDNLLSAVENRFEGTGTPGQTELTLFDRDEGGFNEHTAEYQVGDMRYQMRMHTFVRADEMPHDKMFGQSVRRLQFLKRKLLEDLEEARKIFVYKRGHRPLLPQDAKRLSSALLSYSPKNTLLCVHLADPEHVAGTVEWITPNLLFGYVTHFSLAPGGRLRVPAYSEWATVCRKAHALWCARAASA